jgi:hypothetical protein
MFSKAYSPHIFVYKPQTNSTFSLFLRFILVAVFFNFFLSAFSINFLTTFLYTYFLDIVLITEFIVVFFIISSLGEDFIDYDDINLNYLDIDLVSFFTFFLNFSILLLALSLVFLFSKFIFWASLVAV